MKQSIQLRLGQHLTMTPQLQQAIRLLQLSTLELQLEVQGVLDSNLMLEPDEGDVPASEASEAAREQAVKDDDTRRDTQDSAEAEVTSNSTDPEVAVRLDAARELLQEHGNYGWLTGKGSIVILQNGIEFAVTYLIMLLALLFLFACALALWLSALQVSVTRHDYIHIYLSPGNQHRLQVRYGSIQKYQMIEHPQAKIGSHLIITAADGMQLPSDRPDNFDQPSFNS